ncbi:MAG TPA: hypothetical protein VM510_00960 [Caulifigura sp.]|nr:hypothetical protein [Caulifigura sp.]
MRFAVLMTVAFGLCASGCEALSPSQLWKLNRQPNMDRGDAYFSIPAEMPEDEPATEVGDLEAPSAAVPHMNSDQG